MAENVYGRTAYVMLAIVFALAGALCLSLAFPALEGHTKKTGIRINIWRTTKAEAKLETIHLAILQITTDLRSNLEVARTTLNCLPTLQPLETKVQQLKDQVQEQVEEYRRISAECLTADYNDAFEEALAYEVEGKPTIYWKEVPGLKEDKEPAPAMAQPLPGNSESDGWLNRFFGNKTTATSETKPVYVHQKLRKLIQERRLN